MLRNLKDAFRDKGPRTTSVESTATEANNRALRNPSSSETLTIKVITASKRLYVVCKSKVPSSRSSAATKPALFHSLLGLSYHTAATEITPATVELGYTPLPPGCAIMNDANSAVALALTSTEASALVHTQTTSASDDPNVRFVKPKSGPLGLYRRLKAKYQRLQAPANPDEPQILSKETDENIDTEDMDLQEEKSNDDSDDVDEGDDDNKLGQGPSDPRFEWKAIHAISNDLLASVAKKHLRLFDNLEVTSRTSGTWNFVAFLSDTTLPQPGPEYIIRIPAHGTSAHWTAEDAYMQEREVQLVEYIRQNTKVPVPQILGHSSHCDNELGSPYTIMTKLPGTSAYEIWFDLPYNPSDAFRNADVPSASTEKKRINFLRSLARMMTEIQGLSFNKIGIPEISEDGHSIAVGPSYVWGDEEDIDKATSLPVSSTTRRWTRIALAKYFKVDPRAEKNTLYYINSGVREVLDIVFSQSVFQESLSGPETFTIHHDDLDLQNILVDDDGNVTGIIDWDKSYAAPRCIGASAAPIFLRSDWFPRYTHDLHITPHMGWNEHYYRQIYAAAMVEAGNPDAKYTMKSAMYQACTSAFYGGGDAKDLIDKLIRYIPECRIDTADLLFGLGMMWPAAIEMLERELKKIFEPQLPPTGLLEDLDKELGLKDWWCGFDELLDFYEEEAEAAEDQFSYNGDEEY